MTSPVGEAERELLPSGAERRSTQKSCAADHAEEHRLPEAGHRTS